MFHLSVESFFFSLLIFSYSNAFIEHDLVNIINSSTRRNICWLLMEDQKLKPIFLKQKLSGLISSTTIKLENKIIN